MQPSDATEDYFVFAHYSQAMISDGRWPEGADPPGLHRRTRAGPGSLPGPWLDPKP